MVTTENNIAPLDAILENYAQQLAAQAGGQLISCSGIVDTGTRKVMLAMVVDMPEANKTPDPNTDESDQ